MNCNRSGMPHILFPKRFSEDGKPLCRYCGKGLTGRRTAWCSDDCNQAAMIVCYPSFARSAVARRDKGVCAHCGRDTVKMENTFSRLISAARKKQRYKLEERLTKRYRKQGWPADRWCSRSWWEAHHIKAVVEGGGGTGIENYETVCVPCHKKETKKLVSRRAKARRKQTELSF